MNYPLVSVFIPYYNDEKFLRESIESVLNQRYENIELILLNHASTDSSRDIAHSYDDKRIIHIDMDMNYGAGGGILIKEFIKRARGKYVKFFCADDIMYKNCLVDLLEYMNCNKDKDFVFGNIEYVDEVGNSYNDDWFKSRPHFSVNNDEIECLKLYAKDISFLPYIGSFVKKEVFDCIEIDLSMIMLFDMNLWIQLLLAGKKIGYLEKYVAGYRIHSQQVSAVGNLDVALMRSYFERPPYRKSFAKCRSVDIIKAIFADSNYVHLLNDSRDIPFIVYEYYFSRFREDFVAMQLHDILQDDIYHQYLKSYFGYSIKDYRAKYSYFEKNTDDICTENNPLQWDKNNKTSWKKKIYAHTVKELTFSELIFLIARKIFNVVTFAHIRHKRQKDKRSL